LDRLHAEYGIADFSLMHDLFTVSRKKVLEFCDAVRGGGYTWKCSARMDCVDPELLEAMYDSGCREIYYGIETGTRRMQEICQKKLDLGLFDPTLDVTQALGMSATVSFITGFPLEEQEDQEGTLDLMGSCFHRHSTPLNVQLHLLMPEPGTQLVADAAETLRYDGHVADFNFPVLADDDSQIMECSPEIFMNHHYFETVLPRRRHVFVTSLYQYLFSLGPPVLSTLLDLHDGRLSVLYSAMYQVTERGEISPPFNGDFITDYIEMKLGQSHYLVSLVRYMIAASRLARRIPGGGDTSFMSEVLSATDCDVPDGDLFVLSPMATVLRDLHDCPELLKMLARRHHGEDVVIPAALASERANYLLFHDHPGGETVRNFLLDEFSAGVFEALATPLPVEALRAASASAKVERVEFESFFDQAVRTGIILPTQRSLAEVSGKPAGEMELGCVPRPSPGPKPVHQPQRLRPRRLTVLAGRLRKRAGQSHHDTLSPAIPEA
jgi:hypothetical protein